MNNLFGCQEICVKIFNIKPAIMQPFSKKKIKTTPVLGIIDRYNQ